MYSNNKNNYCKQDNRITYIIKYTTFTSNTVYERAIFTTPSRLKINTQSIKTLYFC